MSTAKKKFTVLATAIAILAVALIGMYRRISVCGIGYRQNCKTNYY